MSTFLNSDECLVRAGFTNLRGPDRKPLPAVPKYVIAKVADAEPSLIEELQPHERLVVVGTIFNEREHKEAEERYAAAMAGEYVERKRLGTPLYIKADVEDINPATGLTHAEEEACDLIVNEMTQMFAAVQRKMRAEARRRSQ